MQFAKAELPAGDLEFDGQVKHVEVAEAPSVVEYVPAPQLLHKVAPVAVEYVPAPQTVHAADPVDAVYCPAKHAVHVELPEAPPAVQEATKPELTTLSSAVNNTCMYPVLDV